MAAILIVEDDPSLRVLLRFVLERAGHTVNAAGDGVEALAMVDALCPDLLISDHEMPRVNGTQLHDLLSRGPGPTPPMILLTAYDNSQQVLDLTPKIAATLYKPFQPGALLAAVEGALGRQPRTLGTASA
jgi:CheY-like chemotaxis protein